MNTIDFEKILHDVRAEASGREALSLAPAAVHDALVIGFVCLAELSRLSDRAPHPSMRPAVPHVLGDGRSAAVQSFMRAFEAVKVLEARD